MRSVFCLAATALIVGCATLPDVHPWFSSGADKKPTIVVARGPLNAAHTAAVLSRVQAKGEPDILARHIAIEDEV